LGAEDQASVASISGTINGSYRLDKLNRIGFGGGIQMIAPFNDDIDTNSATAQREFDENQGNFDASNPFVSFTHMNKFAGIQTILSGSTTYYTAGNLTNNGYDFGATLTLNTMYAVNDKFSFGVLVTGTRNFFDLDRNTLNSNGKRIAASQVEASFGFLPQAGVHY
jgi:hypothetical protein